MHVAALYDIHANLPALEAVVAWIDHVDVVLVGGDVVWGPWPRETMDLLASLPMDVRYVMGNADRDVFDRAPGRWHADNVWCANQLSDSSIDTLRSASPVITIDDVLYCHGSPRSDLDPITIATSVESIDEWCASVDAKLIVCGHTHAQFDRTFGSRRIINAGSVGNPFGVPGAYWAVFDDGEPTLRFTEYDCASAAAAMRNTGFSYAPVMAEQIVSTSTAEDAAAMFS